jgi:hypothetical protein
MSGNMQIESIRSGLLADLSLSMYSLVDMQAKK